MSGKRAKAGEPIMSKAFKKIVRHLPEQVASQVPKTVQLKSPIQHGRWCCCDCGEMFQNNMMATSHNPKHRLGWWTGEGVEEA